MAWFYPCFSAGREVAGLADEGFPLTASRVVGAVRAKDPERRSTPQTLVAPTAAYLTFHIFFYRCVARASAEATRGPREPDEQPVDQGDELALGIPTPDHFHCERILIVAPAARRERGFDGLGPLVGPVVPLRFVAHEVEDELT